MSSSAHIPGSAPINVGLLGGALIVMLGGLAMAWNMGGGAISIDPRVEKACHDEVGARSPLGYRGIMTFAYREDGPRLGVASGGVESRYAPDKWTQVAWRCRIQPESRRVISVEVWQSRGGRRLKAAASAF